VLALGDFDPSAFNSIYWIHIANKYGIPIDDIAGYVTLSIPFIGFRVPKYIIRRHIQNVYFQFHLLDSVGGGLR